MARKSEASGVILKALAIFQLACSTKVKRLYTDGAEEKYKDKLKGFLENQGTVKSTASPYSSASNAFVERRMGFIFAVAKVALKAVPPSTKQEPVMVLSGSYVIEKENFLPIKREGTFTASPHTALLLHGHRVDDKEDPKRFLPNGQKGRIVNTAQHKRKLEARAAPAHYLHCVNIYNYHVHRRDAQKITTIKTRDFLLALTDDKQQTV